QVALAGALGVPSRSVARSCEPAVLGPLIAATLPPAKRGSTRSILVTSARGGVGRSLLVANLARRLALLRATLCVDLTGDGTLSWWLGVTSGSWSDLEDLTDELTAEHLGGARVRRRPRRGVADRVAVGVRVAHRARCVPRAATRRGRHRGGDVSAERARWSDRKGVRRVGRDHRDRRNMTVAARARI